MQLGSLKSFIFYLHFSLLIDFYSKLLVWQAKWSVKEVLAQTAEKWQNVYWYINTVLMSESFTIYILHLYMAK